MTREAAGPLARDLARAEYIRRLVDEAPPLSEAQIEIIRRRMPPVTRHPAAPPLEAA